MGANFAPGVILKQRMTRWTLLLLIVLGTAARAQDAPLWRELEGASQYVAGIVFSPDGRIAGSGARLVQHPDEKATRIPRGQIYLWDTDGRLKVTIPEAGSTARELGFTPDAKHLIGVFEERGPRGDNTAKPERRLRWWNAATGEVEREFSLLGSAAALSPDASLLAVDDGAQLSLVDTATGRVRRVLGKSQEEVAFAFSPDGARLAAGGRDGVIRIWDTATGAAQWAPREEKGMVRALAFSPDGRLLAVALTPEKGKRYFDAVTLWNLREQRLELAPAGRMGDAFGLAFSPDGTKLAVAGGYDRHVRVFEVASGKMLRQREAHESAGAVRFSPDGRTLVTEDGFRDGVKLWPVEVFLSARESGPASLLLVGHWTGISDVTVSPDSRVIASATTWMDAKAMDERGVPATRGGEVRLWDAVTGQQTEVLHGHDKGIKVLAYAPDGQWLATGSSDGTVILWDARGHAPIRTLKPQANPQAKAAPGVTSLSWSSDARTLATVSTDGALRLWEASTGREVLSLATGAPIFTAAVFHPDGRHLVALVADQARGTQWELALWEAATLTRERLLDKVEEFDPRHFALSRDGRFVALSSTRFDDKTPHAVVRLVDTRDGTTRRFAFAPGSRANGLAFSPDGALLALAEGREDRTKPVRRRFSGVVRLLRVADGQTVVELPDEANAPSALAFAPDGAFLVSVHSMAIRKWKAEAWR